MDSRVPCTSGRVEAVGPTGDVVAGRSAGESARPPPPGAVAAAARAIGAGPAGAGGRTAGRAGRGAGAVVAVRPVGTAGEGVVGAPGVVADVAAVADDVVAEVGRTGLRGGDTGDVGAVEVADAATGRAGRDGEGSGVVGRAAGWTAVAWSSPAGDEPVTGAYPDPDADGHRMDVRRPGDGVAGIAVVGASSGSGRPGAGAAGRGGLAGLVGPAAAAVDPSGTRAEPAGVVGAAVDPPATAAPTTGPVNAGDRLGTAGGGVPGRGVDVLPANTDRTEVRCTWAGVVGTSAVGDGCAGRRRRHRREDLRPGEQVGGADVAPRLELLARARPGSAGRRRARRA